MRSAGVAGVLGAALVALLAAGTARAEGFMDIYLGGAFTEDDPVDTSINGVGLTAGPGQTSFGDAAVGGLRAGYWIDAAPFVGFAMDMSGFVMEKDFLTNDGAIAVIPISALFMLRVPIGATDKIPGGRIQPYGAVGPGVFVSALGIEIPGVDDFGDATADLGLDVRGGVKVQLLSWLDLFAEYRFTRFDPEWKDSVGGIETAIDTDLATHHVNVGIGFAF